MPETTAPARPTDRLGRPLHDLRISITDRCNFRCGYCMPREVYHEDHKFLPRSEVLSFEEITRLARLFVNELGVRKLRITGGEPLLRRGLPRLIEMLSTLRCDDGPIDLAMTTNGHLLQQHAQALADAGLRRVTVSLDALDQETFSRMSGQTGQVERVLQGIERAAQAGMRPIKLNCVVQRGHNEHAIAALCRYGREHGYVVRFIEYMDVGTLNGWQVDQVVPANEVLQRIAEVAPIEPVRDARGSEVAERYRYTDGLGEVGLINSITRPFCSACARARLSADGRLITCLFADSGPSLRGMLRDGRSDAQLAAHLCDLWRMREDRYSEQRAQLEDGAPRRRLQMYQVGG